MKGDGRVFKRGETYWMAFYRDGREIRKSCKTDSEYIANQKLRKEQRTSDEDLLEPRHKRVTVGELVRASLKKYEVEGNETAKTDAESRWTLHLSKRFDTLKAPLFNSTKQHDYRAARLEEGASNTTINRELQVLRHAFNLGYRQDPPLVKRVPVFHLTPEDNARRGFANRTQMEALKKAAGEYSLGMRALIEAAHVLGWRRGELIGDVKRHKSGLLVKDVNLADNTVRIEDSKNGDPREVPMLPALRTLLEALVVGKKPVERVFPTEHEVRTAWPIITAKAGMPDLIFHDLRRTTARSKRAAGVDTSVIMSIMGWRTDSMFRRYGIVAIDDKLAALQQQEAYESAVLTAPNSTN